MPLIKTVDPDQALGKVKENYELFSRFGMVPKPFQMRSASPDLQAVQKELIAYYLDHPTLNPALLAFIRMMVAEDLQYPYCVSLNSAILKQVGVVNDDQLGAILADPNQAPLAEKDKAMLKFVLKAVKNPGSVEAADVEGLRELGWDDRDIVDAAEHGAGMVRDGILFKAFKMDDGDSC